LSLLFTVESVSLLPCPWRSESEGRCQAKGGERIFTGHSLVTRQAATKSTQLRLLPTFPFAGRRRRVGAIATATAPLRTGSAGVPLATGPAPISLPPLLCSRVRPPINTETHKQGKGQPESQGTAAPALPPRRIHPRPHPNRAARHAGIFLIFLSLADWSTPQILFSYNLLLRGSGGFHKPVAPSFLAGESAVPPFPHPSSSSSRPALPGSRFPRRFSIRRRWAESRQSAKVGF